MSTITTNAESSVKSDETGYPCVVSGIRHNDDVAVYVDYGVYCDIEMIIGAYEGIMDGFVSIRSGHEIRRKLRDDVDMSVMHDYLIPIPKIQYITSLEDDVLDSDVVDDSDPEGIK
jgi:hypothetical protein